MPSSLWLPNMTITPVWRKLMKQFGLLGSRLLSLLQCGLARKDDHETIVQFLGPLGITLNPVAEEITVILHQQ